MLNGLSRIYEGIINLRNFFYDIGTFKSHELPLPTISVGNLTVGGTGKTPLVRYIAGHLIKNGRRVCIISRGYKRKSKERVVVSDGKSLLADVKSSGDEPFELANLLSNQAIVIADKDRVEAAEFAMETFRPDVFILDDAFQHRRADRDLDIVVVDASNPFGVEKTLPKGTLRESMSNLERADLVIISRAEMVSETDSLKEKIASIAPKAKILVSSTTFERLGPLNDFPSHDHEIELSEKEIFAFCGLGNPDNFFRFLIASGFEVSSTKAFRDHHAYRSEDVDELNRLSVDSGAKALITTAKDAVKLLDAHFELPCYVCHTSLQFENEKSLTDIIDETLLINR